MFNLYLLLSFSRNIVCKKNVGKFEHEAGDWRVHNLSKSSMCVYCLGKFSASFASGQILENKIMWRPTKTDNDNFANAQSTAWKAIGHLEMWVNLLGICAFSDLLSVLFTTDNLVNVHYIIEWDRSDFWLSKAWNRTLFQWFAWVLLWEMEFDLSVTWDSMSELVLSDSWRELFLQLVHAWILLKSLMSDRFIISNLDKKG